MMEQTGGPLSIRQLAEQSFNMREQNKMQQKRSNQHNTVLFQRSIDPVLSQNRKKTPLNGIKRMTQDGLIGTNNDEPVLLNKDEDAVNTTEEEDSQDQQEKDNSSSKKPTFFNASVDINIQKPINNLDSRED